MAAKMSHDELLKPTLHVEALLKASPPAPHINQEICAALAERLKEDYETVTIGQRLNGFDGMKHCALLLEVEIADYTGPEHKTGYFDLQNNQLDVQAYSLTSDDTPDTRRTIDQTSADEVPKTRILTLPHSFLNEAWTSLVFDDNLPARLLRYLVRMLSMMSQPGLNLSTFNWNRLCLLHGPPGSGKSTLCRALSQKLSIRLGNVLPNAILVEINANAMLSKYFGESGKLIGGTFERIHSMAQSRSTLVCVVIDEVETIASLRSKSTSGSECNDGLRATNQLLTSLDRLRNLPNIIVICTSNLIDAIDSAFLDRVDIKQLIPAPSPAAIYNIFRSCISELVRSSLVDSSKPATPPPPPSTPPNRTTRATNNNKSKKRKLAPARTDPEPASSSSVDSSWSVVSQPEIIPTFSEMKVKYESQPASPACRIWLLAQRCHGLSGRTLRRLPILGLAMYTWGGLVDLEEAVAALEAAVEQELMVVKGGT
ncbi:uncharacterized protein LTR77_010110 [Saxophila tyrrhenica]|uniref:AAA+ ATPase domain-containing protein n=1 Tax=Saxophila tyrrhenica TaxID=1690608 RepID=A0AAV9NVV6_9PEZI|nr:hypothetical protein LTR77_010110 [Saxophila tyrrhenica]